jgi:hypothetical protein
MPDSHAKQLAIAGVTPLATKGNISLPYHRQALIISFRNPGRWEEIIMSDIEHVKKTLNLVLDQVQDLERQVIDKKKTANDLCRLIQQPLIFQGVDSFSGFTVRSDEYYGKQIVEVIRSILEKRKAANLGAASVAEIHDSMLAGGYQFQTQNSSYARRGIYSVLAGNDVFHRLPNGRTGLAEWYPAARTAQEQNGGKRKTGHKAAGAKRRAKPKPGANGPKKTRLEGIRELLRKNGPMHRKEIREKTGFPEGTIAFLLKEKNFKHESDGRWSLRDEKAK